MRLACFCPVMLHPSWLGGRLARAAQDQLHALARAGHHLRILSPLTDGAIEFKNPDDAPAGIRKPQPHVEQRYLPANCSEQDVSRALAPCLADAELLLILGPYHPLSASAARAANDADKPYIIQLLGALRPAELREAGLLGQRRLQKTLSPFLMGADCVVAECQPVADAINAWNWQVPLEVVPLGIDAAPYQQTLPRLLPGPYVLALGGLRASRRPDLLAQAILKAGDRLRGLKLVFAGPDRDGTGAELANWVKKKNLAERVIVTGYLPELKRAALLQHALALACPAHDGPAAFPLLEALASGTPILAGDLPEVLTPDLSQFARLPLEPERWAQAMESLLASAGEARDTDSPRHPRATPATLALDDAASRLAAVLRKAKARVA
jgi:glycosyltransferase involved in cell wall biosynthesis